MSVYAETNEWILCKSSTIRINLVFVKVSVHSSVGFSTVPTDSSKEDSNSNYYLIRLFCVIPAVFCTYYIRSILLVFSCIPGYGSFINATLLQQFTHPRWVFCKSGLDERGKFCNKGLLNLEHNLSWQKNAVGDPLA